MSLCPTKIMRNIVSILQVKKKGWSDKNNRESISQTTGKCSMSLIVPCLTAEPILLLSVSFSWPQPVFLSHTHGFPLDQYHYSIFWLSHLFSYLSYFVSSCFSPLMAQTQITWVASKTTIRKGFSLLWFHIIIDIPFSHNAAGSLITSNTERARYVFLGAKSSRSHFNLRLYQ